MLLDHLRNIWGDARRGGEFFDAGLADCFDGAKMGQQPAAPGRADAGDCIQDGSHALFGSLFAVGGDGKAMGFIANALDQI